jgi:hypothetical protein
MILKSRQIRPYSRRRRLAFKFVLLRRPMAGVCEPGRTLVEVVTSAWIVAAKVSHRIRSPTNAGRRRR